MSGAHLIERLCTDRITTAPRVVVNPDAKSPYAKYGKREYLYSPAYYAWRRQTTGKVHRLERKHHEENANH